MALISSSSYGVDQEPSLGFFQKFLKTVSDKVSSYLPASMPSNDPKVVEPIIEKAAIKAAREIDPVQAKGFFEQARSLYNGIEESLTKKGGYLDQMGKVKESFKRSLLPEEVMVEAYKNEGELNLWKYLPQIFTGANLRNLATNGPLLTPFKEVLLNNWVFYGLSPLSIKQAARFQLAKFVAEKLSSNIPLLSTAISLASNNVDTGKALKDLLILSGIAFPEQMLRLIATGGKLGGKIVKVVGWDFPKKLYQAAKEKIKLAMASQEEFMLEPNDQGLISWAMRNKRNKDELTPVLMNKRLVDFPQIQETAITFIQRKDFPEEIVAPASEDSSQSSIMTRAWNAISGPFKKASSEIEENQAPKEEAQQGSLVTRTLNGLKGLNPFGKSMKTIDKEDLAEVSTQASEGFGQHSMTSWLTSPFKMSQPWELDSPLVHLDPKTRVHIAKQLLQESKALQDMPIGSHFHPGYREKIQILTQGVKDLLYKAHQLDPSIPYQLPSEPLKGFTKKQLTDSVARIKPKLKSFIQE